MEYENMGAGVVNPFPGQATEWVDYSAGSGNSDDPNHSDVRGFTRDPLHATAVTSRIQRPEGEADHYRYRELHKPVLDIDMPVRVVDSSTPGHHHLYIDHMMTWDNYVRLLCVLAEVGLVEPGYVSASIDRGHTSVRLPHVKRETPREVPSLPVEAAPAFEAPSPNPFAPAPNIQDVTGLDKSALERISLIANFNPFDR